MSSVILNVSGSYEMEIDWIHIENELRKSDWVDTKDWKGIPIEHEDFNNFVFTHRPSIEMDCYGDLEGFEIECVDMIYEMRSWVLEYFFNDDGNILDPTYTPKSKDELPNWNNGRVLEVK
jgi:hypothetical protein